MAPSLSPRAHSDPRLVAHDATAVTPDVPTMGRSLLVPSSCQRTGADGFVVG